MKSETIAAIVILFIGLCGLSWWLGWNMSTGSVTQTPAPQPDAAYGPDTEDFLSIFDGLGYGYAPTEAPNRIDETSPAPATYARACGCY